MLKLIRILLEASFWIFAAATALFAVGLTSAFLIHPALGYVAPAALVLLLPIAVQSVRAVRRRRGLTALSYVEQAVRLNLPLPRMIDAARRGERGALGRRLADLRELLELGYPVGEALAEGVPEVPKRAATITSAGERLGRLPQTLARLLDEHHRETAGPDTSSATFYRSYPLIMFTFMVSIGALVMIFVIPRYEMIFRDFGIKLPPVTILVMDLARNFGTPLLIVILAATLLYLGRALWEALHPAHLDFGVDLGLLDRALWYLPVSHGIVRDRGLADVFHVAADAFDVATPAERALREASALRVNRVLRERMAEWAEEVSGGMSLHEAARRAAMPKLVVGLLATARGSGDVAEVFGFLARYYRGRFSRSVALLEGAFVPIVVLFFGAIVATVALAMFLPMTALADQLTVNVGIM